MTKGFTKEEEIVMEHIVSAWNLFNQLHIQHNAERNEFITAIHNLQNILSMRILRREYPETFPMKSD